MTPSVSSKGLSLATDASKGLAASPSNGCTSGCTSKAENAHADPLAGIAAALLGLSQAERTRLAAMLLADQAGQAEGKAGTP